MNNCYKCGDMYVGYEDDHVCLTVKPVELYATIQSPDFTTEHKLNYYVEIGNTLTIGDINGWVCGDYVVCN